MTGMGARWRRTFRFRIPVRCPDIRGGDPEILDALKNVVGFLTEDEFDFEFVQSMN
jgi:hypothetical protein